jgi:uncharacterized BrkB/YihY/UPF0761 family membrane protein
VTTVDSHPNGVTIDHSMERILHGCRFRTAAPERNAPSRAMRPPGFATSVMTDLPAPADDSPQTADDGQIDPGARVGGPSAPHGEPAVTGRLPSARARAVRTREQAGRRVSELRTRNELVDAALEAGDIDRRRAGSLLAGGIAFRVFLWLLPAALFAAGVTGLFRFTGSSEPDRVARTLGLGASVATIVRQATKQSQKGPAVLLAIGLVLMLYMSMSLIRALRVAFVLAWEEPFGRRPHVLRDGAILSGVLLVALATQTGIAYLRHQVGLASVLLSLVSVAIAVGLWLGVSLLLPHAEAHWRALVPGAVMFAIAVGLMHFATVYYFAPKLAKEGSLYGSLGTAAVLLLWLFILSRVAVASAFLNATLWRRTSSTTA